jgi:hypothetical protein
MMENSPPGASQVRVSTGSLYVVRAGRDAPLNSQLPTPRSRSA